MKLIRVKITRVGQPNYGKVATYDLEEYIVGVVSSEMSNAWPAEALKAQAIAARTYAMAHMNPKGAYDVDDTTKYQAFRYRKPGSCPAVEAAVKATAGMVLTYNGKLISAVYSASNGGAVRSSAERGWSNVAYLQHKADPWDKATGLPRYGHGVGMSQRGAQWAANHGIGYREILAFYYPACLLTGETIAKPPAEEKELDTLTQGNHGELVIRLQQLLRTKGYAITVDGIFGPQTAKFVKKYQKKMKLLVDGVVGPKTWAALLA